ncbi:MAG: hypothetical protein ACYCW6_13780 [Candidatus Xenobia bacterium]
MSIAPTTFQTLQHAMQTPDHNTATEHTSHHGGVTTTDRFENGHQVTHESIQRMPGGALQKQYTKTFKDGSTQHITLTMGPDGSQHRDTVMLSKNGQPTSHSIHDQKADGSQSLEHQQFDGHGRMVSSTNVWKEPGGATRTRTERTDKDGTIHIGTRASNGAESRQTLRPDGTILNSDLNPDGTRSDETYRPDGSSVRLERKPAGPGQQAVHMIRRRPDGSRQENTLTVAVPHPPEQPAIRG